MNINAELAEALTRTVDLARSHGLLSVPLPRLEIEDARLPRDRYGEFLARRGLIRIDVPRAARSPRGVLGVLAHELAHAATPHLDQPSVWHNAEFQAIRRALTLAARAAELRYGRRRGEPPTPAIARKEPHNMNELPRTAPPRELRRFGALSVAAQFEAIRAWCARHPTMASVPGVKFTVRDDGRVTPHFDVDPREYRRESIDARARPMADRAARW